MRSLDRRRARAPDPAAPDVARAGARVHPRGRVRRGDADERPPAQARARGVEAPVEPEQEGPRAGRRRLQRFAPSLTAAQSRSCTSSSRSTGPSTSSSATASTCSRSERPARRARRFAPDAVRRAGRGRRARSRRRPHRARARSGSGSPRPPGAGRRPRSAASRGGRARATRARPRRPRARAGSGAARQHATSAARETLRSAPATARSSRSATWSSAAVAAVAREPRPRLRQPVGGAVGEPPRRARHLRALDVGRRRHRRPHRAAAAIRAVAAASAGSGRKRRSQRTNGQPVASAPRRRWASPTARTTVGTPAASSSAASSCARSSRSDAMRLPAAAGGERLDRPLEVGREPRDRSVARGDPLGEQAPQLGDPVAGPGRDDRERELRHAVLGQQALHVLRATRPPRPGASRSAWLRTTAIAAACVASGRR